MKLMKVQAGEYETTDRQYRITAMYHGFLNQNSWHVYFQVTPAKSWQRIESTFVAKFDTLRDARTFVAGL